MSTAVGDDGLSEILAEDRIDFTGGELVAGENNFGANDGWSGIAQS